MRRASPRVQSPLAVGPRIERKHLVDEEVVAPLVEKLISRLPADPHARDPQWPEIQIESIYFDDPRRVCYRGRSKRQLPKHRLRRYDQCGETFVEEKLRIGERVWKRRLQSEAEQLPRLVSGRQPLHGAHEWFRRRFRVLDLRPTLVVSYSRLAFQSTCGVRVTLDRRVRASQVAQDEAWDSSDRDALWSLRRGEDLPVTSSVVVEVKSASPHNPLLEEITAWLSAWLTAPAQAYSKYSFGLEAVGLETSPTASTPATAASLELASRLREGGVSPLRDSGTSGVS